MAGLLFARAGCKTLVLEKHADFFRDFRGDTVHPSTLEVLKELGLLSKFLERPHQKLSRLSGIFAGKEMAITDFSFINATCKYIAFMPQWHFLDFLASAARTLPTFDIKMSVEATGLRKSNGRVIGVLAETNDRQIEIESKLVIGADGRDSVIRKSAELKVQNIGAPIDVLWFRVPKNDDRQDEPLLNTGPGHVAITINRGEYYQCALVIPKGGAREVIDEGIDNFRKVVSSTVPRLSKNIGSISSFDEIKLLTVAIDRLENWSRPGLLMIGDSAHAMSPIGGVGINLAVQDAVAAANLLAGKLADGQLLDYELDKIRKRRRWPVVATQFAQVQAQNRIITPLITNKDKVPAPPLPLRIISSVPLLRRKFASLIGIGVRPEHVQSPERYQLDHDV